MNTISYTFSYKPRRHAIQHTTYLPLVQDRGLPAKNLHNEKVLTISREDLIFFGVPRRIWTAVDGVKGRDSHFDRPCPTFTRIYISHSYFTFSFLKSRRLRLDFMPFVGHSVGQMKAAIFAVIKELMPILSCICGGIAHPKRSRAIWQAEKDRRS